MRKNFAFGVQNSVAIKKVNSRQMADRTIDKKSLKLLWLSLFWGIGAAVLVTLIAEAGSIARGRVLVLVVLGALFFSIAVYIHGWLKSWTKAILLFVGIWGGLFTIGWEALPQPKVAALEMKISPSGFPISIPAHSTTSILRINPNRILDATGDYLLKEDNTRGVDVTWPSQKEIDSKKPDDYETIFRVQVANHSPETLITGRLLFHISYNVGLFGGGCMPPKDTPKYQDDVVLLPQLDPGKSFEFYAVNESSKCAWLIPPDKVTVRMTSDENERQVPLTLNADPLYASGAPLFPPTKIMWEALPTRPNSYQIMRQEF
jgi:hypothetical protein